MPSTVRALPLLPLAVRGCSFVGVVLSKAAVFVLMTLMMKQYGVIPRRPRPQPA
jgi:hypothetical protein